MKYPNAARGVKSMFRAQILSLLSSLAMIASGVFAILFVISGVDLYEGDLIGTITSASTLLAAAIFAAGGSVLVVVAFIINLFGLSKASKDEAAFKIALFATLVYIIFSATGVFFSATQYPVTASVLNAFATASRLVSTIYVIQGIRYLAVRLNCGEMDYKGGVVLKLIFVILLLELIARIIVAIFGGTLGGGIVAAVISLCAAVLSLVQYILYLSYLLNGARMLRK